MELLQHAEYLSYVVRHKWFVGVECFKAGIYWRGIVHDWHKFLPSEWFPYVEYFHGRVARRRMRKGSGYYKPEDTGCPSFDFAWLLHQKRADHHWQWWVIPGEYGEKVLPMSAEARLEMICDWCGASKAQGHRGWKDLVKWWNENSHKMRFAPETEEWVKTQLKQRAENDGSRDCKGSS